MYIYRRDAQGNVVALLDSAGNVVVKYVYDAWGNHAVLDANGNDIIDDNHIGNLNPFRYRGYFYDAETGLYYLQTRYYDPEVGRFITIDAIEYLDPETINGLNLYAYCGDNPVMNVDLLGTDWNSFWKGVGNWFVNAGNTIKNFFVDDVYGGVIKPAWDWVSGVAAPAVGNFFTNTIPDFFVNTIWNGGLVPAWNAVSNFFSNTVPDFFVNTFWKNWMVDKVWNTFCVDWVWGGLVTAYNWLFFTREGQILFNSIMLVVSFVGFVVSLVGCCTPAAPGAAIGLVLSSISLFGSFMALLNT